jgi:(5-formylfuran-3-yl)methyl phosphate synthase
MRLLVSVVDAGEARAAAAAGADIVDVKNPAEGSLGAPSPGVIAGVRAAVRPGQPVSAAIGDMPNLPGTAALAAVGAARSGATFVKVGLWGVSTEDDAVVLLRAVRDAVPGTVVVAAAYADARRVAHAPLAPDLLPRVARAAGVGACLLDTAVKDGLGLLEWLSPEALASLVAEAHAAGLEVALAGALRVDDLPVVRETGADIAGVRSAACGAGRRSGPLDAARVRALVAVCAATPPRVSR